VYRYFATRHDLLARVAVEWLGEILTEEPDLSGCVDLEQRLGAAVAYALHVVRAEPMLTRYVMLDLRTGPDYRGGALHQLNRRFTGIITEVLRDAIDTGELRPDLPVTLIRDMIFGAVEHQTWAYLRSERGSPPEQVAADIVAVLRHGIQAGVAVPG
jgi:AcrR family transcriptional regulator